MFPWSIKDDSLLDFRGSYRGGGKQLTAVDKLKADPIGFPDMSGKNRAEGEL